MVKCCVVIYMNSYIFHICFILFILLSCLIFDFVCLTLSSADTHGIAKYARTYIRDTHTQAHTQKKKKGKEKKSPCWALHFMTQERIIFSNATPSKLRLSAAATMSNDTPSALTLPLHCASILQPAAPPPVVAFES